MTETPPAEDKVSTPPYIISEDAIARWVEIPLGQQIALTITRADIDNVYFSIQKLVTAHMYLRHALAPANALSDIEKAVFIRDSGEYGQQSINHIAQFIENMMKTALVVPDV